MNKLILVDEYGLKQYKNIIYQGRESTEYCVSNSKTMSIKNLNLIIIVIFKNKPLDCWLVSFLNSLIFNSIWYLYFKGRKGTRKYPWGQAFSR